VDNRDQPALQTVGTYDSGNGTTKFSYSGGKLGDFGTIDIPLYAPTLDPAAVGDGCQPFPATTPDLSQYVVLIRRGQCTFDTKIANGVAHGAKRFLFYNNVPTSPISPGDTSTTIPVGMVSNIQGAEWIAQLKAGAKVIIHFTALAKAEQAFTNSVNTFTGGKMSTFSSWGPSYEGWLKPQISAPGGIILSTYPLAHSGYAIESGTSMATPYISGVIGLLKQIKGKNSMSPNVITSLLASTARPIVWNDGRTTSTFLAPVVQQGGLYTVTAY
jgi:subtilisin family serine protease